MSGEVILPHDGKEPETKCCDCGEPVDTEVDYHWSNVQEDYLCAGCYESDTSSCATVHIVSPNGVERFYIGKHVRMTEYGDDIAWHGDYKALTFTHEWVSTSAWRGYSETKILGWETVTDGWTTGASDDYIARRKQVFNRWAEDVLSEDIIPPTPVAIISEPTSNVFSTAITVQVPAECYTEFVRWLSEQDTTKEQLEEALT